jgi:hypothetical protein
MSRFTKQEYKNIVQALIASSGLAFDSLAFEGCDDYLTEHEQQELLTILHNECRVMLDKISTKIKRDINCSSTINVIESMYFEDDNEDYNEN